MDDDQSVVELTYRPQGGALELFRICLEAAEEGEKTRQPDGTYRGPILSILFEGPAGCVAGETELWDPQAGHGRRIDELCWSGTRPVVQTLYGPVLAEAPFLKGWADLYRVTLSSGRSCLVTGDHLLLSRDGWLPSSALLPGKELLSGSPLGVRHCWGKGGDSLCDCPPCLRSRGQQPPPWLAASQASSPSAACAPSPSRVELHGGVQAPTPASSRPCHGVVPPSRTGCSAPSCSDPFPADAACAEGAGCRACECSGSRSCGSCQRPQRLPGLWLPQQPSGRLGHDSLGKLLACLPSSGSLSFPEHRAQWETVQTVEYERTDFFYDLHVPGAQHYLAEGIWHHNTGKTRGATELLNMLSETYPGIRQAWTRQTLTSLRESVQVTFEEKVLWPSHPVLRARDVSRESRRSYDYPNGSHTFMAGLDKPERLFSTEWDVFVMFEAIETSLDAREKAYRSLRNNRMPFQLLLLDTNPGSEFHQLNVAANQGKLQRVLSRHEDNPSLSEDYLRALSELTGARRSRLYLGEWVSEEGQVFESFDRRKHVVELQERRDEGALWLDGWEEPIKVGWTYASMDFGYRNPGCLQVWGVEDTGEYTKPGMMAQIHGEAPKRKRGPQGQERIFRLAEWYFPEKDLEWWSERAWEARERYGIRALVADCAEPRSIDFLNDRMQRHGAPRIARAADKTKGKIHGIDQLRTGFAHDLVYLVKDAFPMGLDQELVGVGKPASLEQEIPSYVWVKVEEGREVKELPDPAAAGHAVDAAIYGAVWCWKKDLTPKPEPESFGVDSYGDHWKRLLEAKRRGKKR